MTDATTEFFEKLARREHEPPLVGHETSSGLGCCGYQRV